MNEIKVILADDHRIFRDGIKSLLSENKCIKVIAEASNGNELMGILKESKPDILILDISMPDKSGIELTKEISAAYPDIRILILSMHISEEFIVNAVIAGAKGYLPKDSSTEELIEAIRILNEGGEYYSRIVSENFMKTYFHRQRTKQILMEKEELTAREIEILKLSATGLSNKEISDKLCISIKTVDTHKNHIMQKLKLKNTAEMVLYAVRNGLIEV